MINLLGKDDRRQLQAARLNIVLRRHLLLLGFLAIFLVGAMAFGYYTLMQEEQAAKNVSAQYSSEKEIYAKDVAQGNTFSKDLATAKVILNNEILLSDVTFAISQSLPAGSVIETLDLNTSTLKTPLTLQILTKSFDLAVLTKDSFERSEYFENSVIVNTALLDKPKDGFTTALSLRVNITADKLTGGTKL